MCLIQNKMIKSTKSSTNQKMSQHHPSGMLDRDQRTTLTFIRKIETNENCDLNEINNNSNINQISSSIDKQQYVHQQHLQHKIHHHQHNVFNQQKSYQRLNELSINSNSSQIELNSHQILLSRINNNVQLDNKLNNVNGNHGLYQTVLLIIKNINNDSDSSSYTSGEKRQRNSIIINNSRKLSNRHHKTFYTKRTKLNNLLVCICFWLLILQKTFANPIRMAEEANYCEEARDAIDKILRQSNISYEVNTGKLDNYTQAVFDQHHQDQHSMWRTTQYEGLFPNRESLPFEDYDKEIPEHLLHHIKFEKDVVSHELTNLYHRLKFLDKAFRAVREDHERHKHMLMNRYPGERYSHMVDFFNTQYSYIVALLRETESGMEALNIARPVVVDDMLQPFDGVMELRDWLVTREHLKLLNYVIRAYNVLLKGCS